MKLRTIAALLAAVHVAPALAVDPPKSAQVPRTTLVPTKSAVRTLEVANVAAVPGEKKKFTATLTGLPKPETQAVAFQIPAAGLQRSVPLDTQGKATFEFVLPEIAQGSYPIEAKWDSGWEVVKASGKLTMIKAPTKVDLELTYGTYKNEGGAYGSMMASVKRVHDGELLKKKVTLTVNGDSRTLPPSDHFAAPLGQPDASGKWVVKVQFEGDPAYAASVAEKTLVKSK
jgi:hypothetical protein